MANGCRVANELVSAPLASAQPLQPQQPTALDLLTNAIYGQELSYGANTATSSAGARGPMQIEPATFAMFAAPGENIDNPQDNMKVGRRILQHYLTKYNGDMSRAAVAYYSGEGNVAPPDSPTPWIHNFAPEGAPSVAQYVGQVGQRMGNQDMAALTAHGRGSVPQENLTSKAPSLLDISLDFGQDIAKQRSAQESAAAPAAARRTLPPANPPHLAVPPQVTQPLKAPGQLELYNALLKRQQPLESANG